MCNTWLTVEKHLLYLARNWFKQTFPFASSQPLMRWRVFDDESALRGKKGVFFKTFHNEVIFTVGELKVKCPVQENNVFSVQTGQRKCEISCSLHSSLCQWTCHSFPVKTACFVTCFRCWRVLRSWTTACCWVCTSWTRAREMGVSQARQGGTERDLWVRGCFTPLPWSPSREMARRLKPSPQTTREWAQLGETHTYYAHIFGHTHSLCLCLSLNLHLFSPRHSYTTVLIPCTGHSNSVHS